MGTQIHYTASVTGAVISKPCPINLHLELLMTDIYLYVGKNVLGTVLSCCWTYYTGIVGGMVKPVLPEPYGGKPNDWNEWLSHFESIMVINK